MSYSSRSEIEHERWRPVPGYEGLYKVSDQGRVKSMPREHASGGLRSLSSNGLGYQQVGLWKAGEMRKWYVHRLVLLAFVGPCPEGMEANHKNGDKADNRLENLEYVSRSENMKHAVENGLYAFGERHGISKLSTTKVREIRERYADGDVTYSELAEEYGVNQEGIGAIVRGESRIHEPGPITIGNNRRGENAPNAVLSETEVREIRQRYGEEDVTQGELANEYGVAQQTISEIIRREIWGWVP